MAVTRYRGGGESRRATTAQVRPPIPRGHWSPLMFRRPWCMNPRDGATEDKGVNSSGGCWARQADLTPSEQLVHAATRRTDCPEGGENKYYPCLIPHGWWQEAPLSNTGGQSSIRWLTTGSWVLGPLPAAGFFEPPRPPPPDGPPKAVHLEPPQADNGGMPANFFLGAYKGGTLAIFSAAFCFRFGTRIMCIFFPHTLGGIMYIFSLLFPYPRLLMESCPTLGLTFSFTF